MRLICASDYKRMPWKNSGGETIEVMVSPADASLDTFDWRISIAHVGVSGPFSLFPEIDRTLSVISGSGLVLKVAEAAPVLLDQRSSPFNFPGDIAVESMLVDGPVKDFNVMTRRNRCRHRVMRHRLSSPITIHRNADIGFIFAVNGSVQITAGSNTFTLEHKNTLLIEQSDALELTVAPQKGAVDIILVEIQPD